MAENKVFVEVQKSEKASDYKMRIASAKENEEDFPVASVKCALHFAEYEDAWATGTLVRPEILEFPMTVVSLVEEGETPRVEIRNFIRVGNVLWMGSVARFVVEVYYSDPVSFPFPFNSPLVSVGVSKPVKHPDGIGESITIEFVTEDGCRTDTYYTPADQGESKVYLPHWFNKKPAETLEAQRFDLQRKGVVYAEIPSPSL